MDEKEYRSAYQNVNPIRCVYEKAINSRICNCSKSTRFNLADREGVSCNAASAQKSCEELLTILREKARFALQLSQVEEKLPHNAEMKIQNGGVKGMMKILNDETVKEDDIALLVAKMVDKFGSIADFPFSEIVRDISAYQSRKRRNR
jgi:hypothetical protein